MAYAIQDDIIGLPPITTIDSVQKAPLGMIAHAVDPVLGGGEFIYLQGVAFTAPGTLVSYDQMNKTTTLGPGAAANSGTPLAVAMAATIGSTFGWYQISGNAVVSKDGTALTAGGVVGIGTVAGTVGASSASKQILGAHVINAAATGASTANLQISRPHAQGALT